VNPVTLLGLFAVSAMLVCYALEDRSRWFILVFAAACALGVGLRLPPRGSAVRSGRGGLVPPRPTSLVACCQDAVTARACVLIDPVPQSHPVLREALVLSTVSGTSSDDQ